MRKGRIWKLRSNFPEPFRTVYFWGTRWFIGWRGWDKHGAVLLVCSSVMSGITLPIMALVLGCRTRVTFVLLWDRTIAVAARTKFRVAGLCFGGDWSNSSSCGSRSRCSASSDIRSLVAPVHCGRGAS